VIEDFKYSEYNYLKRDGTFTVPKFIETKNLGRIRRFGLEHDMCPHRSVWSYETKETEEYLDKDGHVKHRPISRRTGDFHVDIDNNDLLVSKNNMLVLVDTLKDFYDVDPNMLRIGFSGSKGFNLIVPRQIFLPDRVLEKPEDVYYSFADFLRKRIPSIDCCIYIRRRLWKMENVPHPKTNLFRVALKETDVRELDIDAIKNIAIKPRSFCLKRPVFSEKLGKVFEDIVSFSAAYEVKRIEPKKNFVGDFSTLPVEKRIPHYMRHTIYAGTKTGGRGRNHAICRLVGFLKDKNYTRDQIEETVLVYNRMYCSPPKSEKEAIVPVDHYCERK
jgi:hypothetical protein